MKKQLKLAFQKSLWVHHPLSRMIGLLAHSRWFWVKNSFIRVFLTLYAINMKEAEQSNPYQYKSFNAFFTRALKSEARPIVGSPSNVIVSPVDGVVSEVGHIQKGQCFQVKRACLSLDALLGDDAEQVASFEGGQFITLYLAPKDYHRVHMPYPGRLKKMTHIPGQLFSVNPLTVKHIPDVMTRNERLIMVFETDNGPMTVVMVGAMIVASLATPWTGVINPGRLRKPRTWEYNAEVIALKKGEEIGHFELGSTVIVLCSSQAPAWSRAVQVSTEVKMGQSLMGLLHIATEAP